MTEGDDNNAQGPYLSGPVRFRRGQVPTSTKDQNLLENRGSTDWVHTDPWRVLRIQSEFVEGFGALAELGPAVSIFGSARIGTESPDYPKAERIAAELARRGVAVITGGGPGVMEAANKGASQAGGVSVGLSIEEDTLNPWVDVGINFRYVFVRKTIFAKYSQGFCALPGGFGTLDEIFEMLWLAQTGKMTLPIVLVGTEFYEGLITWLRSSLAEGGMIDRTDLDLIEVTDDPDHAVHLLGAAMNL